MESRSHLMKINDYKHEFIVGPIFGQSIGSRRFYALEPALEYLFVMAREWPVEVEHIYINHAYHGEYVQSIACIAMDCQDGNYSFKLLSRGSLGIPEKMVVSKINGKILIDTSKE